MRSGKKESHVVQQEPLGSAAPRGHLCNLVVVLARMVIPLVTGVQFDEFGELKTVEVENTMELG